MNGFPFIGITTYLATSYGPWVFQQLPGTEMEKTVARVNRFKTLDGGIVFSHRGVSDGDRDMKIVAEFSEAQVIAFREAIENSTYFNLFNREGVFKTLIKDFSFNGKNANINFYVSSKESE